MSARLTQLDVRVLIGAGEFVLAGECDEDVWTEAEWDALRAATDKLKRRRKPRRPRSAK